MCENYENPIVGHFPRALVCANRSDTPYRHWSLTGVLPEKIISGLQSLNFPVAKLEGVSGKRETHNHTRHYFDQANIAAFPIIATVANAFQAQSMIAAIEKFFSTDLEGSFLRIEYAQDVNGFWLEPHTDLSVKKLTILIYLSDDADHETLGTDIYAAKDQWAARKPFTPNTATAFVPGDNTYHGFEKRPIKGIRRSLIVNYVTTEWRDRKQLAFPGQPVSSH